MIGVYDYTVILTYLSALSAGTGIVFSLTGTGHPFVGMVFLMFCGLFDAFDGKVARTKKDRTPLEKNYGIQIDSLSDIVAFGVLPVCIGNALLKCSPEYSEMWEGSETTVLSVLLVIIMIAYILAGLIRLAYYNVTEEERQSQETGSRKYYEGLPITAAAVFFPLLLMLHYITEKDLTIVYFVMMAIITICFVVKIKIPKIDTKGIIILCVIGLGELIVILNYMFF